MRRSALLILSAVLTTSGSALALEPKTWDYAGGGRWPLVEATTQRSEVLANPTLDRAERFLAAGDLGRAHDLLVDWIKAHPKAMDRDRALFLLGELYYAQDDRIRSFYQFDELLEKYPASRFYFPAIEKQYAIADAFLKGHKRRFLGLPILSAEEDGIDMLFRIQERSPGSPIAERAMLTTADYYYNTGQFDLASDVYTAYLRGYPRSPEAPRVQLRRAFSSYAQFRGVQFDATPLIEARAQFQDIKAKYPELARDSDVQKFIDAINETLARKLVVTADFYRRTDHPGAAVYTLREVILNYPNTPSARTARLHLKTMPAKALAEAPPPPGSAEMPTTAPSAPGIGGRNTSPASVPPRLGGPPQE